MTDRLPFEQQIELKGYIKRMVYENEAVEAAKQITADAQFTIFGNFVIPQNGKYGNIN